jgi:hypothetical protein
MMDTVQWGVSYIGADGRTHVEHYDDEQDAHAHVDLYGGRVVRRVVTCTPWEAP